MRRTWFYALLTLSILLAPRRAEAHEFRPGHLYIVALNSKAGSDVSARGWELRWHAPSYRAGGPAMVVPNFRLHGVANDSGCELVAAARSGPAGASLPSPTLLRCSGAGAKPKGTLELSGLRGSLAEVVLHVPGRSPRLLDARNPSFSLTTLSPDERDTAGGGQLARLVVAGARHVLEGVDHLAFLLCFTLLIFGVRSSSASRGSGARVSFTWRPLLVGVSAFSFAHALASVLVSMGLRPPPQPLEAAIALSIVVVAAQLARDHQDPQTGVAVSQWRSATVFGLVHGLGFGSALAGSVGEGAGVGVGSGAQDWSLLLPSLVCFNLGVELGQLLFVCGCACALIALRRHSARALAPLLLPYLVGTVAAAWSFERIAAMF